MDTSGRLKSYVFGAQEITSMANGMANVGATAIYFLLRGVCLQFTGGVVSLRVHVSLCQVPYLYCVALDVGAAVLIYIFMSALVRSLAVSWNVSPFCTTSSNRVCG